MRIPTATYRVQLNAKFDFKRLLTILDYLAELGISDVYASPVFKARRGSTHGYDVLDPNQLNPELGTDADWKALHDKRLSLNMGWLQDIVPNHMVFSGENPRLAEALEKGPTSEAARFFDIIWDHPQPSLNGRLCAPFLGAPLEECLEKGELSLQYEAPGLCIAYYDHRFPLALKSYPRVFGESVEPPARELAWQKVSPWLQLVSLLARGDKKGMPDAAALKRQLWAHFRDFQEIRKWVAQRLQMFNAPEHRDQLAELLQQQFFHLDYWQNAARAINYRRFFSINDLIAVRQEGQRVFEQTHAMILQMANAGVFTGLRVDHIDGLLTPGRYLQKLRAACGDCYLVVEKIINAEEELPATWPVQGTTGYEFAAHLDRVFTLSDNQTRLDAVYAEFCGPSAGFEAVVEVSKSDVLRSHFLGDLDNLAAKFKALSAFDEDATHNLAMALAQIIIHMPVYRTYRSDGGRYEEDNEILRGAIATAMRQRPDLMPTLLRLDRFMRAPVEDNDFKRQNGQADVFRRQAVGAFEQLCAAMAAKGVEDTALYRFHRLPALNEVGGDPQYFGESRNAFHQFIDHRRRRFPNAMNTLSSHDSKRSGDVRARLLVLSEMPGRWAARVRSWREMNRRPTRSGKRVHRTDPAMNYFLYQTLVATCPADTSAWPDYVERIVAYIIKAAREAKHFTNWAEPDQAYESELTGFIQRILNDPQSNAFTQDLQAFAARVAYFGSINILAQTLIQLTAPGVPDIYQGTELNDDSLVDPDNRRPVDYAARRRMLTELRAAMRAPSAEAATALLMGADLDKIKLYLIHTVLRLRRQAEALFALGDYQPLSFSGPWERHAMAFARVHEDHWLVTVVPRFSCTLATEEDAQQMDLWQDTRLVLPQKAPEQWRHRLPRTSLRSQNGMISLHDLFTPFPVALLQGEV